MGEPLAPKPSSMQTQSSATAPIPSSPIPSSLHGSGSPTLEETHRSPSQLPTPAIEENIQENPSSNAQSQNPTPTPILQEIPNSNASSTLQENHNSKESRQLRTQRFLASSRLPPRSTFRQHPYLRPRNGLPATNPLNILPPSTRPPQQPQQLQPWTSPPTFNSQEPHMGVVPSRVELPSIGELFYRTVDYGREDILVIFRDRSFPNVEVHLRMGRSDNLYLLHSRLLNFLYNFFNRPSLPAAAVRRNLLVRVGFSTHIPVDPAARFATFLGGSDEIANAQGAKCNQELEPIIDTKHSNILRVPFQTEFPSMGFLL